MAGAASKATRTAPRARTATRGRGVRGVPLASIRLLVLDVDGVLTDGRLHYGPYGERDKVFHVRDGHGIRAVLAAGIEVGVISGRRSPAVQRRCRELGIRHLQQGIEDKAAAFSRLIAQLGVTAAQCACLGDDVPDLPIMQRAGLAIAVADAHASALAAAHRRTRAVGGFGAVREVCDWLLAARREP
ncbi:MAG TPA: HAD family hydrolase [Steroidobacteraceae bacterium]|nr:HAD family hydrolase [Steroidobacteraceae bacterium]